MIARLFNLYRRLFWSYEKHGRYLGVKIGKNCSIQRCNFGSEPFLISIGDNVQITADVKFFTHGGAWTLRSQFCKPNLDFFGKIVIGDNVYLGNNALILPGVNISSNCIVGAGSVVTKSIPEGSIVAGNPARIIGTTEAFLKKALEKNLGCKGMNYKEKKEYLLSLDNNKFIQK